MNHGWEYRQWKDVLSIINGKNQKTVENPQGQYPIYGSGGIMSYADDYLCPENCTIIGRKGSINNPIFVKTKFWNVDTAFGLSAKTDILSPKFLFYFCCHYNFLRHNKATTLPSLVKGDLMKILMPVPPMAEQRAIVAELDAINEAIEVKRKQLVALDSLAQSIFYDTFGDPITNPKGWEVKSVKDIARVKIGPFGSLLHKDDYITNGVPLVNPSHMHNGKIISDSSFSISAELAAQMSQYRLEENDIIFGRRGEIGRCALVTSNQTGFLCGTGSLFVRFTIQVNPIFELWTFMSASIKKYLNDRAIGATMLNINCGTVESIPFILSPLALQEQFATQISEIEREKANVEATIAQLQTLLDSRMDYWFND